MQADLEYVERIGTRITTLDLDWLLIAAVQRSSTASLAVDAKTNSETLVVTITVALETLLPLPHPSSSVPNSGGLTTTLTSLLPP